MPEDRAYKHQVEQVGLGRGDRGAGELRQGRAHHIHAHVQRHGKHVRLQGILLTVN